MSRWPVLTACSIPLVVGCAPSVTPGLANAPRLGGSAIADERVTDVVSNGNDACGANERGPLRSQLPACLTVERAPAVTAFTLSGRSTSSGLVVPWLQHFYVGWPCDGRSGRPTAVSWSTSSSPVACLH
jgi:hypothetical protein